MTLPDDMRRIEALLEIMARLRDPKDGCPWDLEQDFASIAPYTIEEAYEVAEAIRQNDMPGLKDELGDLLLQVVFHAQMAREAGEFGFADVVEAISTKMIRRHPHVFADGDASNAGEVRATWEEIKAAERAEKGGLAERESVLDDVPLALPALLRTAKIVKRVARVGFDWDDAAHATDKMAEELTEFREALRAGESREHIREELGDLLFTVANVAYKLDLDPEDVLRDANAKFERRFRAVEERLAAEGRPVGDATLAEMDAAWDQVKAEEKASGHQ